MKVRTSSFLPSPFVPYCVSRQLSVSTGTGLQCITRSKNVVSNRDLKAYLVRPVYCSLEENGAIIQCPVLVPDQKDHRLLNKNVISLFNDDENDYGDETDALGYGMS
jgi:hypothetical protein